MSPASLQTATRRLLFFGLIFSPWAAASEPAWALWTLNGVGFLLFLIQCAQWLDRKETTSSALDEPSATHAWTGWALAGVIAFTLAWCLASALNACGWVDWNAKKWVAGGSCLAWLPHSFDGPATWGAFFHGVALTGFFWGARNWFLQQSLQDGAETSAIEDPRRKRRRSKTLPDPLQKLLWWLGISAALLTVAALLQRATPTPRLLGIFEDPLGRDGLVHFGPFAYRNNAAQYLGMIWPLVLGLWLFGGPRRRRRLVGGPERVGGSPRLLLILCGLLILGGALATLSRGGWGIASLTVLAVVGVAAAKWLPRYPQWTALGAGATLALLGGIFWLAWPAIEKRLQKDLSVLPLNRPEGLSEFTLAGTLNLEQGLGSRIYLMGVSPRTRDIGGGMREVYLGLDENGGLVLQAWNTERRVCGSARVPDFLERFRGHPVELVIIFRDGLRLFVNGQLLAYLEPDEKSPPWPTRFSGDYVKVGRDFEGRGQSWRGIDRIVVWDRAITPRQVSAWLAGRQEPSGAPAPLLDFNYAGLGLRPLLWMKEGTLFSRSQVWASALEMARLAQWPPFWGGGPGAYPGCYAVSPARLPGLKELHVHNDYLEFLLTFGIPGGLALLGGLGLVLGRPFLRGGIRLPRGFVVLLWTSLLGCLLFAFVDWPFFAPAVHLLFVVLCAVLSAASIRKKIRPSLDLEAEAIESE